jgi:hypothetical protein
MGRFDYQTATSALPRTTDISGLARHGGRVRLPSLHVSKVSETEMPIWREVPRDAINDEVQ